MSITNGDFESGAAGWSLVGDASIGSAYGAHGGDNALAVKAINRVIAPTTGQATSDAFDLISGHTYDLVLWLKLDTGDLNDLTVSLDAGSGLAALEVFDIGTYGSGWIEHEYEFTATGTSGQLRFETAGPSGPFGNRDTRWLVDDIALGRQVITAQIRTALLADFAGITIANGFEITVVAVYPEPKRLGTREVPSIALVPGEEGESVIEQLTNRTGKAVQLFEAELLVKSDTPHADIQKLLDSARNSVERSNSATCAVASVHQVDASDWERIDLTDDDIGRGYAIINLGVRVEYSYSRGAV